LAAIVDRNVESDEAVRRHLAQNRRRELDAFALGASRCIEQNAGGEPARRFPERALLLCESELHHHRPII
ncbi:MAG TPA: hypothetical protein VM491_16405, partial [Burkholderiaceae bacterium]|nr:hypothetical protein [Burkholderiaceae bacterium]